MLTGEAAMMANLVEVMIIVVALVFLVVPTGLAVFWQTYREAQKKAKYHESIQPGDGPYQVVWDKSHGMFNAGWEVLDRYGAPAGDRKVDWFSSK